MRRFVKIAVLVLVLGLLASTVVSAETVEGTGTITARGAGVARVHGSGTVDIRGHGVGTVWVRNAETLKASGRGIRWDLPGGIVFFAGWSGHIYASGEELAVTMIGGLIELSASGTGTVLLKGRGNYWLNGEHGPWNPEGITLQLQPVQ